MLLGRQPFLKKNYFYSVFLKNNVKKNLNFWTALPQKKKIARCWITSESSLIGPKTQNTKTLIGTKICHKNPQKNPIFVVRKWAPQEVVLFLTLEVVPKLTLERPKSGTKTNSPAYIYIYGYSLIWGPIVYRGVGCFLDTPSFRGVWVVFVGVSAAF